MRPAGPRVHVLGWLGVALAALAIALAAAPLPRARVPRFPHASCRLNDTGVACRDRQPSRRSTVLVGAREIP